MGAIIDRNGGYIDKYMGDGIINKRAGTTALVSHRTREQAGDGFRWGRRFSVTVKGKQEPLILHELLADSPLTRGGARPSD